MAKRLKAMGKRQYENGFRLTLQPGMLGVPYKWKSPRVIFVNSMSDLFHKNVPTDYIQRVFHVMNDCPQHTFQVLTKRPERTADIASKLKWTSNIWMGTSVEDSRVLARIDEIRKVPAAIRFLSLEPLLGPLPTLRLTGIHWVIAGGESGPKARPMEKSWVLDIQQQCGSKRIPFFFKQWGGPNKKKTGRDLDGKTWDEMPFLPLQLAVGE
jgi:protein gp37